MVWTKDSKESDTQASYNKNLEGWMNGIEAIELGRSNHRLQPITEAQKSIMSIVSNAQSDLTDATCTCPREMDPSK